MAITIKNEREIEKMRAAGRVVAICHQRVEEAIAPGVTTADLDAIVRDTVKEYGATASFLGYHGFSGNICASVNEVIVHGIPGDRRLNEGDIISVDIGAIVDGWHGDSAWTYPVGAISEEARRLLDDTEASLYEGLHAARAGNHLGEIGHAVETFAVARGYGVVRGYGGHGIGRRMHEDPHVPNYGDPQRGPVLRKGMTLAIEPMLTLGTDRTRELSDGWTVVTTDGSWAAHFEHTVAITEGEPIVLTERLVNVIE
ncbi:MAG TPA: type I methionyl aminopeptidase [Thermomicrobiales bacterium]|nr:type I methionyl aminopeptidase [Thermomicrobiales bacterium]